jgi:hypothetical protein
MNSRRLFLLTILIENMKTRKR